MPEIIDLEVAKENMMKNVGNEKVKKIKIGSEKVLQNAAAIDIKDSLQGAKLNDINRVSKVLIFNFEGDVKLAVHLMLHGDFCWKKDGTEVKNVMCEIGFENGRSVLIKDWSRWMKIELKDDEKGFESELLSKPYGIDPLSEKFTLQKLNEILSRRSRAGIKSVLMDQEEISGLGNAYTDEILWEARIDPRSKCGKLVEESKVEVLFEAIINVLEESLDIVRELSKEEEIAEQERDFMKVYKKKGTKCPSCEGEIKKIKVVGRQTFICESCQQLYK